MSDHRVLSWEIEHEEPTIEETWVQINDSSIRIAGGMHGVAVAAFGDERQVYRHTSDGRLWLRVQPEPIPLFEVVA